MVKLVLHRKLNWRTGFKDAQAPRPRAIIYPLFYDHLMIILFADFLIKQRNYFYLPLN